jgi:hypothetical protein
MRNLGNMYISTESESHQEEKPFDPVCLPITEVNKSKTNLFSVLPSQTTNMNNLNERLLEKIKIIKNYEKEIKDKNILMEKLQIKVDKQQAEIKKLKEKLIVNFIFKIVR